MLISKLEDRLFASFLAASVRVYEDGARLVVGNRSLPITPEAVHVVTGLPRGKLPFPQWDEREVKAAKNAFRKLCDD